MSTGSPHGLGLVPVAGVGHVLAFELTSDRPPLFKSMANVLTLFPTELFPWAAHTKLPRAGTRNCRSSLETNPRGTGPQAQPLRRFSSTSTLPEIVLGSIVSGDRAIG